MNRVWLVWYRELLLKEIIKEPPGTTARQILIQERELVDARLRHDPTSGFPPKQPLSADLINELTKPKDEPTDG